MRQSRAIRAILGALILVLALAPASALGISRETVLARGKVWVDRNTPYSQSRYATLDGTVLPYKTDAQKSYARVNGYRTDCSGYVSMCLGLKNSRDATLSLTTRDLHPAVLSPITKEALAPGDVMLLKGSHVVLFVGWADDEQKTFTAYEERGTDYGTVRTTRTYSQMTGWGYKPYRYNRIDDFYADCQQSIYGLSAYATGAQAAKVSFPMTYTADVDTLVVSNTEMWTGNLGAAALAGVAEGPLLPVSKTSLPSSTTATIKRLEPKRVYIVGGRSSVSTEVAGKIAKLGAKVVRVSGKDRYATAAATALKTAALAEIEGRTIDAAYLVGKEAFYDGIAVSPISARTVRPVLITQRDKVPAATLDALKQAKIRKVYVLGNTDQISTAAVKVLQKRGISVTRRSGANRYENARAIAMHGLAIKDAQFSYAGLGVTSGTKLTGMLACGVAQGQSGSLMLLTPSGKLDAGVGKVVSENRKTIGKVRVFGGYTVVELPVRTSLAKLMRAK